MSEKHPAPRTRSRRAERMEHLYTSREALWTDEMPPASSKETQDMIQPLQNMSADPVGTHKLQSTATDYEGIYPGNEPGSDPYEVCDSDGWSQKPVQESQADYAAYYSRDAAFQREETESAFAPPPKMEQYAPESFSWMEAEPAEEEHPAQNHVYRPLQATWAETERQDALSAAELGYQVREEKKVRPAKKRKKRHILRNLLVTLLVLAVAAVGVWFAREPLTQWIEEQIGIPEPTAQPYQAVTTPEPIHAYDAAPPVKMADSTRTAISRLSGSVEMEQYIVTDTHVVTRNLRENGTYDFYLFTAEGRLLAYFEGLEPLDMIPLQNGGFYVAQEPYLISAGGSAMIRTQSIEAALGDSVRLHPLCGGWSIVENEQDGSMNYVNVSGQVLSTLWFSKAFPFTGETTLAYVDTGSTVANGQRYLLYVISRDGTMSRWLAADDMSDVTSCTMGMAYMSSGDLYRLPDTSAPVVNSPEIHAYLDCDAMVVRDEESGKYGLFVHGEQHYDFAYDSIRPVAGDIRWGTKTLRSGENSCTLYAVEGASYPQPLSHSFVLERDGQSEYVALSTQSSYPIRLDGEF